MKVRVRNFQSIKDATIDIVGFTVITGPNNSGKTAFMRAVRGLFTNASPGPYVRSGEAFFIVDLTFEDGQTITWEKGWERPEKRGNTINRYIVNGKLLAGVGRGPPPEIEAFLVRDIPAGSERLWPQIARQFDGTLFLVDKPGSTIAEALSDVERVGRLSDALRLSDADRRSVTNELKIRRSDLITTQQDLDKFQGLDGILVRVKTLSKTHGVLAKNRETLEELDSLRDSWKKKQDTLQSFKGFDKSVVPQTESVLTLSQTLTNTTHLLKRLKRVVLDNQAYQGFSPVVPKVPNKDVFEQYNALQALRQRWLLAKQQQVLTDLPKVPDTTRAKKIQEALAVYVGLHKRHRIAYELLSDLTQKTQECRTTLLGLNTEFQAALEARGNCPTCGSVCSPEHVS